MSISSVGFNRKGAKFPAKDAKISAEMLFPLRSLRFNLGAFAVKQNTLILGSLCALCVSVFNPITAQNDCTWTSDNGNGTFTNPLFYEEFSDPDMIRVGDAYYLTGTTMHTMPGLPVLHSKDLVNWELISYAVDRLDVGPELRMEDGKEFYGQGIWAPCFRYHNGTFYIFSNVNRYGTQIYYSKDPKGPWKHKTMRAKLHDVTVLFDDDGKIYAVWGYDEVKMVQLTKDLMDVVPGTEKVIIERSSGAGEGSHIYKINGKYYITNTNYDPMCYQVCLRADHPYGPYEVNVMSAEENFGGRSAYAHFQYPYRPPFPCGKISRKLRRLYSHASGRYHADTVWRMVGLVYVGL